jgi:hypothetical protein
MGILEPVWCSSPVLPSSLRDLVTAKELEHSDEYEEEMGESDDDSDLDENWIRSFS